MKYLAVLIALISQTASAGYEYLYKERYKYVITDLPCEMNNPDNYALRDAYAIDTQTGKRLEGCALIDRDVTEFQLYIPNTREFLDIKIPSQDLKFVPEV